MSIPMLQVQYLRVWPVQVIRQEGYLLIQLVEGVAGYSPIGSTSTAN
jgi:hypothetical protein